MPKLKSNPEKIMEATTERGPYGDLRGRAFMEEIARMTGVTQRTVKEVMTAISDLTAEELYWYGRVHVPGLVTFVRQETLLEPGKLPIESDYMEPDGSFIRQKIYAHPERRFKFLIKADQIFRERLPEPSRNNWRDIVAAVRAVVYGKIHAKYVDFISRPNSSLFTIVVEDKGKISSSHLLSKRDRDLLVEDKQHFLENYPDIYSEDKDSSEDPMDLLEKVLDKQDKEKEQEEKKAPGFFDEYL